MVLEKNSEKEISKRLVNLIDITFGVVVACSFTILFDNSDYTFFKIDYYILLLIAYFSIILSWIGYHRMIENQYYKQNILGYLRFGIDILLIFLYAYLLYSYDNLYNFLLILPIIFLLYLISGIIRNKEHNKVVNWSKGSIIFTFLFLINFILYNFWINNKFASNFVFLSLIYITTFVFLLLYRIYRHIIGFKDVS